jgi:hypothetical protein
MFAKSFKLQQLFLLLVVFLLCSCSQNVPNRLKLKKDREKILEINRWNDLAITTKNYDLYRKMDKCANDSGYNVIGGEVHSVKNFSKLSNAEIDQILGFNKIIYTSVTELMEPIVNFSPDGKMAYVIGKARYCYETTDS